MKQVRFNLPPFITILDTIYHIRKQIHLSDYLSLEMLPRFQQKCSTPTPRQPFEVVSQVNHCHVDCHLPLRSQGILPGDILIVLPKT